MIKSQRSVRLRPDPSGPSSVALPAPCRVVAFPGVAPNLDESWVPVGLAALNVLRRLPHQASTEIERNTGAPRIVLSA
jgi:hypothetical protein